MIIIPLFYVEKSVLLQETFGVSVQINRFFFMIAFLLLLLTSCFPYGEMLSEKGIGRAENINLVS